MKTVLLVIPRTFCVRAFLMTAFFERLAQSVNVAVLSPFGDNPDFVRRFKRQNVSFYKLPDFLGFQDKHKWWHNLYSEIMNANWNLKSKEIENGLRSYLHNNDASDKQFSIKSHLKQLLINLLAKSQFFQKHVRNKEKRLFWESCQVEKYEKLFSDIKPEIIISTKSAVWDEYPIACFGEKYSIPQITYVLSFDNITTNGVFPTIYDKWLVWNDINKNEILNQYREVKDQDITICGPLQFDFYSNRDKYLLDKVDLFKKLELDTSRALLLIGSGPQLIAPQEPFAALQIAQSIRDLNINGNPQLLIRLHPDDRLDRWQAVIIDYPEVRFSLPWKLIDEKKSLAIPTDDDTALLASTLFYSDVVINTSSSMTLDAAVYDRPVICLAYDESPGQPFDLLCKKLYEREHYVPITESGGAVITYTHDQTIEVINEYIINPGKEREQRLKMLRLFDPYGDGNAAVRSANSVLDFLGGLK